MKWAIAFTILILSLTAGTSASAEATDWNREVQKYVATYESDSSPIIVARARDALTQRISQQKDKAEYAKALKAIETQLKDHPQAGYALAKDLETEWELRYGTLLAERQQATTAKGRYAGAIVAMALSRRLKPESVGKYFQLVRYLLPVAGAKAGSTAGNVASELMNGDVPPAPAQLLQLQVDGKTIENDAHAAATMSALFGFASVPAVDWAAKKVGQHVVRAEVKTPRVLGGTAHLSDADPCAEAAKDLLKLIYSDSFAAAAATTAVAAGAAPVAVVPKVLSPISILGAWVVADATDRGLAQWADRKQMRTLENNIQIAGRELAKAQRTGNRARLLSAGDAVLARTQQWYDATKSADLALLATFQNELNQTPEKEVELREKLNRELENRHRARAGSENEFLNVYNRVAALEYIRAYGKGALSEAPAENEAARAAIQKELNELERRQQPVEVFVEERLHAEDESLLKLKTDEKTAAGLVILKNAALIRKTGGVSLEDRADELMELAAEEATSIEELRLMTVEKGGTP